MTPEEEDKKHAADMKARWIKQNHACACGEPITEEDAVDNFGECGCCYNLGSELSWSLDS